MPKPKLIFFKSGNAYGEGILYCLQNAPLLLIKVIVLKGNRYTMEVFATSAVIYGQLNNKGVTKECTQEEFSSARMIVVDNMIQTAKMLNV